MNIKQELDKANDEFMREWYETIFRDISRPSPLMELLMKQPAPPRKWYSGIVWRYGNIKYKLERIWGIIRGDDD